MLRFTSRLYNDCTSRDRAIIRAVVTAVGAKGCGILLQILAIPYAIRILGVETFGVYAAATALFAWLSLLEVGIGANLVKGMVGAISRDDAPAAGKLFRLGLRVTAILAWSMAFIVLGIIWLWGLFNEVPGLSDTRPLFVVAACLAALHLSTAAVTRARSALQETHINNLYGAVANLISAVLLLVLVRPGMSSVSLLLALNGPLVFAQLVNGIVFIIKRREWLTREGIDWHAARVLMFGGSWLGFAQVGVFLEREAPKLVLAASTTAVVVGHYACAVQILMIMAGVIVMVSTPLMPAVADAIQRGETRWWKRRVLLVFFGVIVLGSAAAAAMTIAGTKFITLVFGESLQFTTIELVGVVAWGTMVLLSHVLYTVLVAAGKVRAVAGWQLLQGFAIIVLFSLLHPIIGLGGMFWVAALLTLLLTLTPWGLAVYTLAGKESLQ